TAEASASQALSRQMPEAQLAMAARQSQSVIRFVFSAASADAPMRVELRAPAWTRPYLPHDAGLEVRETDVGLVANAELRASAGEISVMVEDWIALMQHAM